MSKEFYNAEQSVRAFFDAYLLRRDLQGTLIWLTEDVQWVGIGKEELAKGREEVERILKAEFAQAPESCQLVWERLSEMQVSSECVIFLCELQVRRKIIQRNISNVGIRVTAACIWTASGWKITSIHDSFLKLRQENEALVFPNETGGAFAKRLKQNSIDLLGKSIPGGMMGGYVEPGFPLYYINDRMLQYLGYSYKEFVTSIDGMVINGIHPEDRERVTQEVLQAFAKDQDYESRYRMAKKDGSYIHVSDIGRQVQTANGRKVCISVIRDISAAIKVQDKLRAENQKYDHLFQSVLCGIVQFQMVSDGEITFKNANREAIRILGYEPEEFWENKKWFLSSFVAEEDQSNIFNSIQALKNPRDREQMEYRVKRKDGSHCWILGSARVIRESDEGLLIQSVYLDIDSRKRAETENLQLSVQMEAKDEILRLALQHTSICEFYYYPQERLCVIPPRTSEHYHCCERYENMPYSFMESFVKPEHHATFCQMYEEIHQGARTAVSQFQTVAGNWCRVILSIVGFDKDGAPNAVAGLVEDITKEQIMALKLAEAKSRDNLTGLWDREAGTQMVREFISHKPAGEHCVMMLLDMDNFTWINEVEGVAFANAVLQEVADILRAETAEEDLRIRLGGDEFMLLVKKCDKAGATVLGTRIAARVQELLPPGGQDVQISVSIGMCSTEVVDEYTGLYQCAESTLKYVKEHGRGKAACYLDTSNELGVMLTNLYPDNHPVNVIEQENARRGENMVPFALELLGKSKKLEDAVALLFARLGKTYLLDRVSLLEIDPNFLTCRFTYQWARDKANLCVNKPFYITKERYDMAATRYDAEGLSDSCINKEISPFPCCLHSAIWDQGVYIGAFGFEVAQKDYVWTEELRQLLAELGKILSSFIMKARADAVSQAKTDFLSRMSHEIRTPMNAIAGMTAIARTVAEDKEKVLECLDKLDASNQYLLSLINDILDMSRIESGKMEIHRTATDLGEILNRLDKMLRPQAERNGLVFKMENDYLSNRPLLADQLRLEQVLINIIGNAVKFTKSGSVCTRVCPVEMTDEAVCLHFSVTDTGIGIAPESIQNIFHAFEQAGQDTAVNYGGTGLGLTISSRLVQMMGGKLEVVSELGKGSTFFFTLTFSYAEKEVNDEITTPDSVDVNCSMEGKRVLLVEDHELNREIVQTLLEQEGLIVETAADGLEAVQEYQQQPVHYYDAILMDIRMPHMDGLEATRRIRTMQKEDSRTIPIIAMTANAFDEDTKRSLAMGMNGHLTKPIEMKLVMETLRGCIKQ